MLVLSQAPVRAQDRPFNVYVDGVNCALTRAGWMAVGQDHPGFGFDLATGSVPSPTFAEAMALLDALRIGSTRFADYCCKTTAYRDSQTGTMSIGLDRDPPPPPINQPMRSGICCEDAALLIGADPLGCTVITLASVPGAAVIIGPTGPVSPAGPVTIPSSPPVAIPGPTAAIGGPSVEYNTDRPGGDYSDFDLGAADPLLCQAACQSDPACRAWTYVNPGVQGPSAHCWLKSSVPAPAGSACCASGVM